MAVTSGLRRGNVASGHPVYTIGQARGTWVTVIDDASTAMTSAEQSNPALIADDHATGFRWYKRPKAVTRVNVVARVSIDSDTFTASPAVRIIGLYGDLDESANTLLVPTDSTVRKRRLDAADWNTTSQTLSIVSANQKDEDYRYSTMSPLAGYDVQGADYIGVMVTTAANIEDGGTPLPVPIDLLLYN